MHFRKLVAIVVRDFVGHILLKSPLTITPEEIEQYLNTVKCRSELVNDIFLILFKNLPKHKEVREFVECWTRNPRFLIGPIFPDTYSVINKRFKFNDSDFDPYHLKLSDWNCAVHNNFYDPHEATILKIQEVLAEYDHPVFPSSRLYEVTTRIRRPVVDYQELPPLRRVRRKCYEEEHAGQSTGNELENEEVIECFGGPSTSNTLSDQHAQQSTDNRLDNEELIECFAGPSASNTLSDQPHINVGPAFPNPYGDRPIIDCRGYKFPSMRERKRPKEVQPHDAARGSLFDEIQEENTKNWVPNPGMSVLTTIHGGPWLAGVVEQVESDKVLVKFPFQYNGQLFEYPKENVRNYQSQFIGTKFLPLKPVNKTKTPNTRAKILRFENNLKIFLTTQCKS